MIKILIADDDGATRKMISQCLDEKKYSLFETANGLEAYAIIKKENINIAILDWILPDMTGIDICKKIRKEQQSGYVFIVMLTVKNERDDLLEGFAAGVDEYVKKPVNLLEFQARIKVGERIIGLEQSLMQKQKELFDINQMKNKFLGIAAHDLRNPIISIRGFSELVLKDPSNLTDDQKEFLSIIYTTSRGMLAMLNDLLDVSLIESGRMEINKRPESLIKIIQDKVRVNSFQANQKQISIHQELLTVPSIEFDSQRIGQAVDNLISNAIKFAPYGTNIYLILRQDGDIIKFSVRDEGPGIPREEQHLLFSEFHRLSIRPTAGETSTGLGLAITKKIMEAHGGTIEFESSEGAGSTFCLVFPIHPMSL
ncbi:MAG: response regulator [Desulfobacterales bacterium]|jgi:signal transduction histidine kinase|nr:response regulator [Desulfobacterales bacterium]